MLAELDAKGISWDPASSIREMRMRVTRVALTLPAPDRALDVSDINPFSANTGTFYDHMSSYALSNGELEDVDLFRQFRSMTAGGYCAASMSDATFLAQISFVRAAAIGGRDGTSLPELAIAALAVAFIKRTRPPDTKLDGFVPFGGALDEIARRNADSDAERFKPLFEEHWRGYENIGKAFNDEGVTGQWAFNAATALAARWGLGAALTPAVAASLDTYLSKALPACASSAFDAGSVPSRLVALNNLDSASLGTAIIHTTSAKESSNAISEQLNLLFNVQDYKDLKLQIEPFATTSGSVDTASVHKVVQLLAGATSPIGLMVLNGTRIPGPDWQSIAAAQAKTGWLSCLTSYMAIDNEGEHHPEWINIIGDVVPERRLSGGFSLGDGKAQHTIHLYKQVISGLLSKQEGAHVAELYESYETKPCAAIFSDAQLLRYSEKGMCRLFAFIGFKGRDEHSFPACWRALIDRAQKVSTLPPELEITHTLEKSLHQLGSAVFNAAAEAMRVMLKSPLGTVRRYQWLQEPSMPFAAFEEFDKDLAEIMTDLKRGKRGLGRNVNMPGPLAHAGLNPHLWQNVAV